MSIRPTTLTPLVETELRTAIAKFQPNESSVAKVSWIATYGFLAYGKECGIAPNEMVDLLKILAPSNVTLSFDYRLANEEVLRSLFLTPNPENQSVQLKRCQHLTPSFMEELASARPHLIFLDLRYTPETVKLINAYLAKQRKSNCLKIRIAKEDLSPLEKKEFDEKYPHIVFIDGNSHLDLSKSSLTFDDIIKKVRAQPHLKTVDLRGISGFNLLSLYRMEKELNVAITYDSPDILDIHLLTEELITIQEIEALLYRFDVKTVDLRSVKELTIMDLLYLEDSFPTKNFLHSVEMHYTLPFFDEEIVEKLYNRFSEASLYLLNVTKEDVQSLRALVEFYPTIDFKNGEHPSLLQNPDLLKFYLTHTLINNQKTALSSSDLEWLTVHCPSIEPTIEKIRTFRNKTGNHTLINLRREIARLKIDPITIEPELKSTEQKMAYSFEKLINKEGEMRALYKLGTVYEEGKGVTKNDKEAVRLYTLSANQGYANAQNRLGHMYEIGTGVTQDYKEAARLYTLAADQGYAAAQNNLGILYEQGKGVDKDDNEAIGLYELAADQGYAAAQFRLARMYERGKKVTQNYREVVKLYTFSADQGYADAQYHLGILYEDGKGVAQDNKEAARLYSLSANQGSATAQFRLARMYENGKGVTQNYKEAARLYTLSADQGYASAQNNLGILYEQGKGVATNSKEAIRLYKFAADQEDAAAQNNLGLIYEEGITVPKNSKEAFRFFTLSANQGYAAAQYSLGLMYENGQEVDQNYIEAMRLYLLSAAQGNQLATKGLKRLEKRTNTGR